MKEGWTYKKLGEVCDFEGGSQPPKSEWINHPQDGYIRMLQIRDFTKSRNAEIEFVKVTKKLRLCNADDILIGRYGASVGKILTGLAGAYNVAIIKSIPNEALIAKSYIRRFFESSLFQSVLFKVCASRAAQAGFSKDDIYDTIIPVPPLSEQLSIVSHLDSSFSHIDTLKANAEKQLNEAKALFQKALEEEMKPKEGWTYKKLGEVCETLNGLWKGKKPPFVNVGVIRNANFTKDFTLRYDNVEYLDVEEKQYTKRKLQKGDLIIEKSGGSEKQPVGRAVLFEKENGEFSFSNFTSVLRIRGSIMSSRFLYIYLLYIYKRGDTLKMQKATTGIHNIEFEKYLNIDIPILDKSEQQRIVSHLDSLSSNIRQLEEIQRKTLAECDALKQAMLREVFE